jgi:hypothetical protein
MSFTANPAIGALRSPAALDVARRPRSIRRPLALDTGDLLRIVDGAGTRIVARSGILWITDERSHEDVVLQPGQTHRIATPGVTIVEAHRPARLVVEAPHVARMPAALELVFGNGGDSRDVSLLGQRPTWLAWLAHGLAHAWRLVAPKRLDYAPVDHRPRARSSSRHDAEDFTPEAVRDRLLRSSHHPYF